MPVEDSDQPASGYVRTLRTSRCELVPLERDHLEERVAWINDPDIGGMLFFDYPTSLAKTRAWFDRTVLDGSRLNLSVLLTETAQLIGMTGLLDIDYRNSRAEFYISIGKQDFWGQGLAQEVIPVVLDYAFEGLGLNRIYLQTTSVNTRAQHIYQKAGFTHEATLRSHAHRVGGLADVNVFGMLRHEWRGR